MKRTIKNLLRIKHIHYKNKPGKILDEDVLFDYCMARDLPYWEVHDELEKLGYDLI